MCYILLDLFGREREVRVLEKKEKAIMKIIEDFRRWEFWVN
jgi:hypothetical protein